MFSKLSFESQNEIKTFWYISLVTLSEYVCHHLCVTCKQWNNRNVDFFDSSHLLKVVSDLI